MKFAIVLAAFVAVSTAQLRRPAYNPFPSPTPYSPFAPSPTPYVPFVPSVTSAPRPVVRPSSSDQTAQVVRYDNEINPDGSYNHGFETDNGISAQAQGVPKNLGGNPPAVAVVSQGSFSWTSPEGQTIYLTYTADENGYQAAGDAIPTPHPIPEAILRSLEYNAKYPQPTSNLK